MVGERKYHYITPEKSASYKTLLSLFLAPMTQKRNKQARRRILQPIELFKMRIGD